MPGWAPAPNASPDSLGGMSSERIRARARDLQRNSPMGARIGEALSGEIVGRGHTPRMEGAKKAARKRALEAWWRFVESSDSSGALDFDGQMKLAVQTAIFAGEAFLRWYPDPKAPGLWRVDVLEPEFCDAAKTEDLKGGGRIVQGVEFDAGGARVAYHLFRQDPREHRGGRETVRVSAQFVDHVYLPMRPGQTRGVSWLAPVMRTLRERDDHMAAILRHAALAASIPLILRNMKPMAGGVGAHTQKALGGGDGFGLTDGRGGAITAIGAGTVAYVSGAESIETLKVPEMPAISEPFALWDREIAAGVNLPVHMVNGDLSKANYSSLRADEIRFRRTLDPLHFWIQRFYARAWARVQTSEAEARGAVRGGIPTCEWSAPRRPWVDPKAQAVETEAKLKMGLTSLAEAIAELGGEIDDVADAIKMGREIFAEKGLDLDQLSFGKAAPQGRPPAEEEEGEDAESEDAA